MNFLHHVGVSIPNHIALRASFNILFCITCVPTAGPQPPLYTRNSVVVFYTTSRGISCNIYLDLFVMAYLHALLPRSNGAYAGFARERQLALLRALLKTTCNITAFASSLLPNACRRGSAPSRSSCSWRRTRLPFHNSVTAPVDMPGHGLLTTYSLLIPPHPHHPSCISIPATHHASTLFFFFSLFSCPSFSTSLSHPIPASWAWASLVFFNSKPCGTQQCVHM